MKRITGRKLLDWTVNALFIGLAGGSGIFAGYMVIRLNGMENPPANMGLNFPPAKKRVITDESVEVDSMATQSITRPAADGAAPGRPAQPWSRQSPVMGHRLLTVVDGLAFVEVTRMTGKEIVAVSRGSDLPGAGGVAWIERVDGRWQLKAGDVSLTAVRP